MSKRLSEFGYSNHNQLQLVLSILKQELEPNALLLYVSPLWGGQQSFQDQSEAAVER